MDPNENEVEEGGSGIPEEVIQEARSMGWKPLDEFNGNEDDWRDADEFVERGRKILPIVQANNKRLQEQLLTSKREVDSLKETVDAVKNSLKALRAGYDESVAREVAQAKKQLREQLVQAREVGDFDAELDIQDQLDDLKEKEKASKKKAEDEEKETKPTQPKVHPEFEQWQRENPWFGDQSDPDNLDRTQKLLAIGEQLRLKGDTTVGRAFMDKCVEELEKQSKSPSKKAGSKVESGSHGAATQGGGRSFNKLPKEAKQACHEDNEMFVGPGKMFKTVAEWEDHYAELYLNSGE